MKRSFRVCFDPAFTHHFDPPSHEPELPFRTDEPRTIPFNFRQPVVRVRLWFVTEPAPMTMPKTAMNEDDRTEPGENDVRVSWQVASMETETEARPV